MSINMDAIERRARKAMKHAGHSVVYDGAEYDCIPTSMRDNELKNRDQTFRADYKASIAIISSDATITEGDKVTYRGTVRRVLELDQSGDGVQTVLHLGSEFGGGRR